MTLRRGRPIGYDRERMFYMFTMSAGEHVVTCEISGAALSALAKRWKNLDLNFDEMFDKHRDLIEQLAEKMFDGNQPKITIYAKNLPKR